MSCQRLCQAIRMSRAWKRPTAHVYGCHARFHSSSSPFIESLEEAPSSFSARLDDFDMEPLSSAPTAADTGLTSDGPAATPSPPSFKFLSEEQASQLIDAAKRSIASLELSQSDLVALLAQLTHINRKPELIAMTMDMYHMLKAKLALTEQAYNAIFTIMINNMSGLDCYKLFLILFEEIPPNSELVRMRAHSLYHEMKLGAHRIHAATMTQLFFRLSYYEAFPRLLCDSLDRMSQLGLPASPALYVSCIFQLVRLNHPQLAAFHARVRSLGIDSPVVLHYMISYYLRSGHIELAKRYRDEFLQSYAQDHAMHLRLLKAFCFHLYFKEALDIYDLFITRFCTPSHPNHDTHFRSINSLLLFFLNRVGLAHPAAPDILSRALHPTTGQPHSPEHYSLLLPLYLGHPKALSQLLRSCSTSKDLILADPKILTNMITSYLTMNEVDTNVLKSLDIFIAFFDLDASLQSFDTTTDSTVPRSLFHLIEPLDKRLAWLLFNCHHFSASLYYRLARWLWRRFAHTALYALFRLSRTAPPTPATQFLVSGHSFQYFVMVATRCQDWYSVHELIWQARKTKLVFHANRFPIAQILFDGFRDIDQTLKFYRVFAFHEPLDAFFALWKRHFALGSRESPGNEQAHAKTHEHEHVHENETRAETETLHNEPPRLCSSLSLPHEDWLFSNSLQAALAHAQPDHPLTLAHVHELKSLSDQMGLATISELKRAANVICPVAIRPTLATLLSVPPPLKALLQKDLDIRSRAKKEELVHLERKPRIH